VGSHAQVPGSFETVGHIAHLNLRDELAAYKHGKAVQVEPIKSKLKPPGTERLKQKYDNLLSRFAFKYNLRRYST